MRSTSPRRLLAGAGLVLGLAASACGTDGVPDDTEDPPQTTWYQDVAPILSKHCMSCHKDGGIAPFALTDYDSARANSALMLANVDSGAMPPFDAREQADCTPRFGWQDDQRLSDAEKATLHAWVDGGHALGLAAEIALPPGNDLPAVTKTLTPAVPWTTSGDRDQFICYVLDPGNETGKVMWMDGLQVRPGNPLVVHHAVLTELMDNADTTALIAAHGIGQPWDCDQQATPAAFVVGIWTPGNQPVRTPADLAIPIVPKGKLVMQIHYHPAGVTNLPDTTQVDIHTTSTWPRKMYFVAAIGNEAQAPNLLPDPEDRSTATPEFRIPQNSANHTERMRRTIDNLGGLTGVKVYSVNPHMHLVGTHINGKIERPSPTGANPPNECLANGGWNFDWQRTYIYDAPIDDLPSVEVGDTLEVSCTWNNTIENPFVQRMLHDAGLGAQPVDITLGEQTTNEMCLEIFGLAVDAPPQPVANQAFTLPDLGKLSALPRLR